MFWVAFGLSALLHVLLLFLVRGIPFSPMHGSAPPPSPAAGERALRLYQLVISPDADAAGPELARTPELVAPPPALPPLQAPPSVAAPNPPAAPPAAATVTPPLSAAELLRPRPVDPRLRPRGQPLPLPPVTEEERLRDRVYSTLQALADSAAAADEAARRALDWTITDSQGRKWGVSPGAIHIAGITLPLPLQFTTPAGRRDEVRDLQREWADIQRQAELGIVRATVQERAAAIRERNDRDRAATAGSTAGSSSGSSSGSSNGDGNRSP